MLDGMIYFAYLCSQKQWSKTTKFDIMEIYKTTFKGAEVSVLFNGSHYFFHSSYYGVLAIAERDYKKDTGGTSHFALTTGNRHADGGRLSGSVVASLAKKFIRKAEQRFIKTDVTFDETSADLANGVITLGYTQY